MVNLDDYLNFCSVGKLNPAAATNLDAYRSVLKEISDETAEVQCGCGPEPSASDYKQTAKPDIKVETAPLLYNQAQVDGLLKERNDLAAQARLGAQMCTAMSAENERLINALVTLIDKI